MNSSKKVVRQDYNNHYANIDEKSVKASISATYRVVEGATDSPYIITSAVCEDPQPKQ